MDGLRGQRFVVDLDDDDGNNHDESPSASRLPSNIAPSSSLLPGFIADIKERHHPAPPSPPTFKSTPTGFPEHRKRTRRISAFKQKQQQQRGDASSPPRATAPAPAKQPATVTPAEGPSFAESEKRQIDEENRRRLAAMTAEEIEEERRELFNGLDPSLLKHFMARANLDTARGDTGIGSPSPPPALDINGERKTEGSPDGIADGLPTPTLVREKAGGTSKSVRFGHQPGDLPEPKDPQPASTVVDRGVPAPIPRGKKIKVPSSVTFKEDHQEEPREETPEEPIPDLETKMHFPNAPSAPDLDPADPEFLENLHHRYFPSLPADPSKLAWMAPIPMRGSVADQESPYYPGQESLPASALRFDFRGGLLPPRISRAVPATKGLHHHGEAPESAGYTVPELARLGRSAFPAQRCMAFQVLGRMLYRLGRGEWGDEASEIPKGLWRCVEEGKVVDTLEEAASAEGGHQGSKVYATEALWLWQKGGGKRWKAS